MFVISIATIRMAFGAERQVSSRNALLKMFLFDLLHLVFMAAIAGVFHIAGRVAGLAGDRTLIAMVQREAVTA